VTGVSQACSAAIAAVRPDFAAARMVLHALRLVSDAVEAGGTTSNFPSGVRP